MKWLPLVLILSAGGALAAPPTSSLRPVARGDLGPAPEAAAQQPPVGDPRLAVLRPRARPDALPVVTAQAEAPAPEAPRTAQVEPEKETLLDLLRPLARGAAPAEATTRAAATPAPAPKPEDLGVAQEVEPKPKTLLALLRPKVRTRNVEDNAKRVGAARRGNMICGVETIQGIAIGNVPGNGACGVEDAVRVSSVSGVSLSTHAVMDCTTARALNAWVAQAARPAIGTTGGGLSELRVAAHYACRTRNNQRGAKLSEHSKGHAIDIAGFKLRNGQELTVLGDWHGDHAKVMRAMHKAACGPFGTVLGPDADRFHRDHFHFDTARYRAGTYCR
ncbi:extensin-like domain-containing protein [Pseudooceanicola sp.]|uniref:extensin-like domain-containing protein n=1 Tax=Pseudooceanicola sp. TaxID=1914328 RepID=UPI00405887ED